MNDYLKNYPRSTRFTEEFRCPRAEESPMFIFDGSAIWMKDNRCSYCGSLHPDILMERLEHQDAIVAPTDKNYKIYVKAKMDAEPFSQTYSQRTTDNEREWITRNVSQTKFYFQHLSKDQMVRFIELLNEGKLNLDYPGRFYVKPFFIQQRSNDE